MINQQYAAESNSVLLNILGILRWATPADNGGWDVQETYHNGTTYMEYHTFGGEIVWNVKERGGYPDKKEWAELEAAI
jgi:predicted Rdx family selenoprotein